MKILIVDDEESIRRSLEYFVKQSGHECMTAVNGEEGLTAALTHKPQVIISDIVMPVCDGLRFLEHLREQKPDEYTPVIIMISGYADDHEIQKAYDYGARWTLRKPIRFSVLKKLLDCIPIA